MMENLLQEVFDDLGEFYIIRTTHKRGSAKSFLKCAHAHASWLNCSGSTYGFFRSNGDLKGWPEKCREWEWILNQIME